MAGIRRRLRHAPDRALSLANSSILDFNLNTPNATPGASGNSLLQITGGLSIGKGITLNVSAGTGWGNGVYYLATYSGTVTDTSSNFTGWTVSGAGLGSRLYDFSLSSVAGGTLELTVINASDIFGTWNVAGGGVGPTPATGWAATCRAT